MPTVGQDVSGDSALQTAIAALKAKIEGAKESSDIAQLVSDINTALAGKQNTLTFDSSPSNGSSNPVTSGGIKTALDGKQDTLTFDSTPAASSTNPVTSGGIKTALNAKQDTLIFDTEPTAESTKPVTSGGVKEALDDMYSEISDHMAAAKEDIDIRGGAIYESASGSLVEITDGADDLPIKSAVVTVEPIQDLHGYDSPWPAGGGKNKCYEPKLELFCPTNGGAIYLNNGSKTAYAKVNNNTDYVISFASEPPRHSAFGFSEEPVVGVVGWPISISTISATAYSFNSGNYSYIGFYYLQPGGTYTDVNIQIEQGKIPSAFSPYSNICPISGRTGVSVVRCGKNLIDDSIKQIDGTRLFIGGGPNDFPLFLKAGTYALSCDFLNDAHYGAYYKSANSSNVTILASTSASNSSTFTITKDNFYALWFYNNNGVSADNVSNIMLNVGDTTLQYEPYKGSTYSVNWETEAGTVYGGRLDVLTGKLTVDRVIAMFDGSEDESWSWTIATNRASISVPLALAPDTRNRVSNCNMGTYLASGHSVGGVFISNTKLLWYYPPTTVNSLESYRAWLAENNLQVVYELANPVEYQLTPQEVRTLLGENNIWSDGGDMSVEYPADTKTYIDNKIAEAIAAAMA